MRIATKDMSILNFMFNFPNCEGIIQLMLAKLKRKTSWNILKELYHIECLNVIL